MMVEKSTSVRMTRKICRAHAVCVQCACSVRAVCMQCACSVHAVLFGLHSATHGASRYPAHHTRDRAHQHRECRDALLQRPCEDHHALHILAHLKDARDTRDACVRTACAWAWASSGDPCGPREPCSPGADQAHVAAARRRGGEAWRRRGRA
eukprot:scaffold21347_cov33-Phaeocystis_antarctica.AAC.1